MPRIAGLQLPRALRWVIAALLAWGLFTGIGCLFVPLLTVDSGNYVTFGIGVLLTASCSLALLHFDPRD